MTHTPLAACSRPLSLLERRACGEVSMMEGTAAVNKKARETKRRAASKYTTCNRQWKRQCNRQRTTHHEADRFTHLRASESSLWRRAAQISLRLDIAAASLRTSECLVTFYDMRNGLQCMINNYVTCAGHNNFTCDFHSRAIELYCLSPNMHRLCVA